MTLKHTRMKRKLTQTALAGRVDVDQRTISKLETGQIGEPSYRMVVRICRVLAVDPESIDEFRAGR